MKKRLSKANEEMGYRPIDGGQKIKKKGDENRNSLCWLERKKEKKVRSNELWK